jgi:hypothetical protein
MIEIIPYPGGRRVAMLVIWCTVAGKVILRR